MGRFKLFIYLATGSVIAGLFNSSPNALPICYGIVIGAAVSLTVHWFAEKPKC